MRSTRFAKFSDQAYEYAMTTWLSRLLSATQHPIARQFLRFGTVGFIGFFFDAGTVYATKGIAGLYVAGMLGYVVAATVTWWLNRIWTFHGQGGTGNMLRQWAAFMSANFVGFLCNRGVYTLLITFSSLCVAYPVLAILAGIPAGLVFNFHLSRRLVFKA